MTGYNVQVLLDPHASDETRTAVQEALTRSGLSSYISLWEGKSLPDVPWEQIPWNQVVTIVLDQAQGVAEDARGFLLGLLFEHFRQRKSKERPEAKEEQPLNAEAPTQPANLEAAEKFRRMIQDLQELQVPQARGLVQVRLILGDLWVDCPDASASGAEPFLALLDPGLDIEDVGGFFGVTRWDATLGRWVPQE